MKNAAVTTAMQLLLKRDNDGKIVKGANQQLHERAYLGDDLCLFIESVGYDETIMFGNYVLRAEGVSALSLPHLAHGDLPDPTVLDREPVATAQYIYDSQTNNVLVKDFLDEKPNANHGLCEQPGLQELHLVFYTPIHPGRFLQRRRVGRLW